MNEPSPTNFTPRETVSELDRYIIGQGKAKRAVAIALRNRWRRRQVDGDLRDEIVPKNIIMIGPTGVGKTEIARRLAKLARAPFVKVEASKFTEVGYVGRDVESMIRDLVEMSVKLVRDERVREVQTKAEGLTEDRLVELIIKTRRGESSGATPPSRSMPGVLVTPPPGAQVKPVIPSSELEAVKQQLRAGELEDEPVELDVQDSSSPFMTIFGQHGMEELNVKDMLSNLPGFAGKTKRRSMTVADARPVLQAQEADKLVDMDKVHRDALARAEQEGIVFLDEIDKVAGRQSAHSGPDVSREGVQRDLLPVVEGSTVSTKYGAVRTDHILFIAAGAFHVAKVSDLIPELQGRFPIRVELDSLKHRDFVRILTEPKTALTKQYEALMKTEGLDLVFEETAVDAIAGYAFEANQRSENIGARRLHAIMEALLEEISFSAPERPDAKVAIDGDYVRRTLDPILGDEELARYIL